MSIGISRAKGDEVLLKKGGTTGDIINAVLDVITDVKGQTKGFSKRFAPTRAGMYDLWAWIRTNIHYNEDPLGVQWIREPGRLWHDKEGDCKSFTVFAISVLENLGLDYRVRFSNTERPGSKIVNHVYPIAILPNGQKVIIDSVYPQFDREKSFNYAKDYTMADIYRLSGIGNAQTDEEKITAYMNEVNAAAADIPDDVLFEDVTEMTAGEFSRYQAAQKFDAEAATATTSKDRARFTAAAAAVRTGNISGIGAIAPNDAAKISKFLKTTEKDTKAAFTAPVLALPDHLAGIGSLVDAIKTAWKKIVNWLFKQAMPAAAPFFLYAWLKKNVGPKTERKRKKQLETLNWIQKAGKFDSEQAVLNAAQIGIIKQYGKNPKQLLNSLAKGQEIAGIGSFAIVAVKVVTVLVEIISKIAALFKKNKVEASSNDVADASELSSEIIASGNSMNDISTLPPSSGGGDNTLLYGALMLGGVILLTK